MNYFVKNKSVISMVVALVVFIGLGSVVGFKFAGGIKAKNKVESAQNTQSTEDMADTEEVVEEVKEIENVNTNSESDFIKNFIVSYNSAMRTVVYLGQNMYREHDDDVRAVFKEKADVVIEELDKINAPNIGDILELFENYKKEVKVYFKTVSELDSYDVENDDDIDRFAMNNYKPLKKVTETLESRINDLELDYDLVDLDLRHSTEVVNEITRLVSLYGGIQKDIDIMTDTIKSTIERKKNKNEENVSNKTEEIVEGNRNEEALKVIHEYAFTFTSSYEESIDLLMREKKFTREEATYAADNCGADWKENALATAKATFRFATEWSKESVYDDLILRKFTDEEASYAVSVLFPY